ncbi:MAG: XRE family transcriptional regulator [Bacteroidetes bacterium]|nr:XRE family transcriptional regulator [Bacteroidota bacterium]MCL2303475.1 XRE family transcriptional regulator [Lentimicrobiaceae bacterium]
MNSIHINHEILRKLEEKERSIAWLAKQVNYDRNNLRKILKNNRDIYANLLFRISLALEEDFFACYSKELNGRLNANKVEEANKL